MIDKKLKESIPKLKLGIVSANVKVSKDNGRYPKFQTQFTHKY